MTALTNIEQTSLWRLKGHVRGETTKFDLSSTERFTDLIRRLSFRVQQLEEFGECAQWRSAKLKNRNCSCPAGRQSITNNDWQSSIVEKVVQSEWRRQCLTFSLELQTTTGANWIREFPMTTLKLDYSTSVNCFDLPFCSSKYFYFSVSLNFLSTWFFKNFWCLIF